MSERSPEFWEIIETHFPEYADDRLLDAASRREVRYNPDADEEEVHEQRLIAASYDKRIAEYFLDGRGTEGSLIAQLMCDYALSQPEVEDAINKAIGHLHEMTDYGDEA